MMKQFKLVVLTVGILFAGMGAATAVTLESIPEISNSTMAYCIKNGVATLYGHADSGIDKAQAARYVAALDGVDRVINLVSHN